ncbi:hypothetical protein [Bradyrhizobium sp. SRS-191]|uniref:hypothetical protein n=1 Tax=Bradyrhizobium sp. SRS-191 TaxID=2962606 RepID=UPI00211DDA7D|nr:hypothetical protein [Bradyrhizobium sp. SRS-191]
MQAAVRELLALGALPHSHVADVETLKKIEGLLLKVEQPICEEDAEALVSLLGPDDCFGLAWTLVHLIETAPGWPLEGSLEAQPGRWTELLKARSSGSRS